MAEITADLVKKLRDRTGMPLMKCKEALVETERRPRQGRR